MLNTNEDLKTKIVKELALLRAQVEEVKSELYLMRMSSLENRAKSFCSDKKRHKIAIREAKCKICNLLKERLV